MDSKHTDAGQDSAARETVLIERMSYGPAAIGHLANGKTVFVPGAAPGDTAEIAVIEEKARFANAKLLRIAEAGPARAATKDIPCPLAAAAADGAQAAQTAQAASTGTGTLCGGCPWAHLHYETQLAEKRANVVSALVRTGRLERERAERLVAPCIAGKRRWGYRNKLELACSTDASGRLLLGLHNAESNDISPISACPLACKPIASTPKALQGALRFMGGTRDLGLFRVGVRGSIRTRDMEVALWTEPGPFPRNDVARVLKSAVRATSIVRVIAEPGKARKIKGVEQLVGKGSWEETLNWNPLGRPAASECAGADAALDGEERGGEGHDAALESARFLTSAPSFFQVNTAQAEVLVECVLGALQHDGFSLEDALVADLYAGGGTFSIPLARAGANVVAVEAAGSSVRDLRRNAEMNREFVEVVGGDTARELPEIGELDALVVDPPRAGLAPGVVESIAAAQPARVAYVSCDPQTLARDIALFEQTGYRLQHVQPVDLFPQTYHVECVALLIKAHE